MSEVRLAGLRPGTCVCDMDTDVWVKTTFGATFVTDASEKDLVLPAVSKQHWTDEELEKAEKKYGPFTLIGDP